MGVLSRLPRLLAGLLLLAAACAKGQAAGEGTAALRLTVARAHEFLPLEVTVNGAKVGPWVLARREGILHAPQEALAEWRMVRLPPPATVEIMGNAYVALSSLPGYEARIDTQNQTLALTFSPELFGTTRLAQDAQPAPRTEPPLTSAFFHYDLNYGLTALRSAPSQQSLGMLGELGVSSALGVFTSSFAALDPTGDPFSGERRRLSRLETSFVRYMPSGRHTLRLGDATTRSGLLGRQIYFGGLQFGTHHDLTPGFVTQPQPVLGGVSYAPSTVELYVNDVLRQVSSVPTGPFALNNLPVLMGNGEARLVVRDLLGRETVIVQPFFVHPRLLAPGLSDWNVSGGRLRKSLGVSESAYRDPFLAWDGRKGLTDQLTTEARADWSAARQYASLGATLALPAQVLGQVALGASSDRQVGSGRQWMLGLERQGQRAGVSIQAQGSTLGLRHLSQDEPGVRRQLAGTFAYQFQGLGSLGLGFARIDTYPTAEREAQRLTTVSANYSVRLAGRNSLNITASRAIAGERRASMGMSLIIPLDRNTISTASAQRRGGQQELLVTAARSQDAERPVGWRLLAGHQQDMARLEGGLYHRGPLGQVSADLSAGSDVTALRLSASGALVLAENRLYASQRTDGSFALVELAGHSGVGVGLGATMITRTNEEGRALLPNLVAFQQNYVRLNASEVPLSAELDSIEKTTVPPPRSVVKVVFPVRGGRAALLRILLEDGQPAPAGATLQIEGDPQVFYVARRGEAYVSGLQPSNRLLMAWEGKQCRLEFALPAQAVEDIIRLEPVTCRGVLR